MMTKQVGVPDDIWQEFADEVFAKYGTLYSTLRAEASLALKAASARLRAERKAEEAKRKQEVRP